MRAFLKAFTHHWSEYMSGGPSVPLMIAALFVGNKWFAIGTALLGIVCGFLAAYFVWGDDRRKVIDLTARLTPKLTATPEITFERYGYQNAPTLEQTKGISVARIRVEALTDASVLSCEAAITAIWKRAPSETVFHLISENPAIPIVAWSNDVHPNLPLWYDIVCAREENNVLTRADSVQWPLRLVDALIDTGTYRFRVVIAAPGVPSETVTVDVEWPGQWDTLKISRA